MNCKKIQELLMADYLDAEISTGLKQDIEQHLKVCQDCARIDASLRKMAVTPFKNAQRFEAPDEIWQKIREKIVLEREKQPRFLNGIFLVRRPIFAAATMAAVIITVAVFTIIPFNNRRIVRGYLEEQADFINSLGKNGQTNGNAMDYLF